MLPLDIIFIGPDRRITNIAERRALFDETSVYSDGPAIAVLELNRRQRARRNWAIDAPGDSWCEPGSSRSTHLGQAADRKPVGDPRRRR